jgi:hypothetical protein
MVVTMVELTELQQSRSAAKAALLDYAGLLRIVGYDNEYVVLEVRQVAQEVVAMSARI